MTDLCMKPVSAFDQDAGLPGRAPARNGDALMRDAP